ncbi:MAG: protein-glutamate O-methyltransferase CheR [Bacteroidota bacterium]|nr:protein-glutamate O-methyltransferase CheR [Bacteroidota bacterium]MDW8137897.1 protein-glutamate O-methyltransferase CheR [Bacteroidota bacterium]
MNTLVEPHFTELRRLLEQATGMYFDANRRYFLEARVQLRMRALGIGSVDEYIRYLLQGPERKRELERLQELVAVHETYFFRHPQQLHLLRQVVLPKWRSRMQGWGAKVRIWSSGCASGEEPYSVLMLLIEQFGYEAVSQRVELLATDLSEAVLEKARKGLYGSNSFRGHLPAEYLARYFLPQDSKRVVREELRKLVHFRAHNLNDPHWDVGADWDLILCRNVLIYFDSLTRNRIIGRFYELLRPGGYLALGESESLYGSEHYGRFEILPGEGAMLYRKPEKAITKEAPHERTTRF